jgi:hypothetical protein
MQVKDITFHSGPNAKMARHTRRFKYRRERQRALCHVEANFIGGPSNALGVFVPRNPLHSPLPCFY